MTIQIRQHKPSDNEFILSLVSRFSEFKLPEWRQREEIDGIHLQTETDYFREEKYGYISDLAVDAAFEGQGIGLKLLETAEEWARANGYRLLALYAFSGNRRAREVYEKFGFQEEVIKYVKAV